MNSCQGYEVHTLTNNFRLWILHIFGWFLFFKIRTQTYTSTKITCRAKMMLWNKLSDFLLKLYVDVEKYCSDKKNFFVIQAKLNSWKSPDIANKRVLPMKIKNQVNGKENWFAIWVRGRYNEAEVLSCQETTWQSNSSVSVFSLWSESATITTTKNKLQIRPIPYCNKTLCQNIKQFHQHHQTIEKVLWQAYLSLLLESWVCFYNT